MVKKELVAALIADGAKVLRALDRDNFPVDAMFWVHLPEDDYWRLVIGSPLVSQFGSAAGYSRLNKLLRDLDLAGITLEDISLVDRNSPQFHAWESLARSSSRLAVDHDWVEYEEAIVYRWTPESVSADLSCDVSEGDLERFWATERKLSDQPAVLIRAVGRRVNLRFHPQHVTRAGIESVERSFTIALHRPDARPDCKINWLG